jgi:hypothetical protein
MKLNAYYAFPATSSGGLPQPYASTCMDAARGVLALTSAGRQISNSESMSSPLFIWSCWVAARIFFSKSSQATLTDADGIVHSYITSKSEPGDEFDAMSDALKRQSPSWPLAGESMEIVATNEQLATYSYWRPQRPAGLTQTLVF